MGLLGTARSGQLHTACNGLLGTARNGQYDIATGSQQFQAFMDSELGNGVCQ